LSECKRKGVKVLSTLGDIPINDDATSNLLLAVNGWKAQIERESIAYRTKLKLEQLKALGVKLGRKHRMILEGEDGKNIEDNKIKINDMIKQGIKFKFIAKNLNCTVMTLRKFIKKYNLNN
jgi:DNA invertase Pin-like site-specific DNA recombinase